MILGKINELKGLQNKYSYAIVLLCMAFTQSGCTGGDDPWVRMNFGASNMRWVPQGAIKIKQEGDWLAATLRPQYTDYFVTEPFSILLNKADRPAQAHTTRDWLTRAIYISNTTDLNAVLAYVPVISAQNRAGINIHTLTLLADGRLSIQTENKEGSLGKTIILNPRDYLLREHE